jgi:hypothetical protein
MAYATWGRSLATTAPPGLVGDETIPPAAQPPGLIPGTRATCPAECTPRPRNPRVYKAACAAAEGEPVREYDAFEVEDGMRAFCGGSFLTVIEAQLKHLNDFKELRDQFGQTTLAHPFVLLRLEGGGATTGWLIGELDTPVYCLA